MNKLLILALLSFGMANATGLGSNKGGPNAGWQVEPCSYSNDNALCVQEKDEAMERMMILAALVETVGKKKAEACRKLAVDVRSTTKKPVEGYTYYKCLVMFSEIAM